eukprot:2902146-Pleurochrysis_carterae.AAC.1
MYYAQNARQPVQQQHQAWQPSRGAGNQYRGNHGGYHYPFGNVGDAPYRIGLPPQPHRDDAQQHCYAYEAENMP